MLTKGRLAPLLTARLVVIGTLVAVPIAAQGGDDDSSDTDQPAILESPLAEIEANLDFGGRTFVRQLPFDEFFSIYGTAGASVKEMEISLLERRAMTRIRRTSAMKFECFEVERRREAGRVILEEINPLPCDWLSLGQPSRMRRVTDPDGKEQIRFELLDVNPLRANHHYVFRFVTRGELSPEALARFDGAARELLNEELGKRTRLDVTAEDFKQLQTGLKRRLETIAGGQDGVEFSGRGFFSSDFADLDLELKQQFELRIQNIAVCNKDMQNALGDWGFNQDTFAKRLQALDSSALVELKTALETRAMGDESLQTMLATNATALQLIGLGDDRFKLAKGLDPMMANPSLDFAARRSLYDETTARLRRLRELLSRVTDESSGILDSLQSAGPLSPANANLIKATREDLLETLRLAAGDAFTLMGNMKFLADKQGKREAEFTMLQTTITVEAERQAELAFASTVGDFDTRQRSYLSIDAGFATANEIDEVLRTVGLNLYLRPVNRKAAFADIGCSGPFRCLGRKFAFTMGFTEGGVGDGSTRADLFSSNSMVVGAGIRVTPAFRLGLGAVVFKEIDPNPLISDETLQYTPYFSITYDWNIRNTLATLGWMDPPFGPSTPSTPSGER